MAPGDAKMYILLHQSSALKQSARLQAHGRLFYAQNSQSVGNSIWSVQSPYECKKPEAFWIAQLKFSFFSGTIKVKVTLHINSARVPLGYIWFSYAGIYIFCLLDTGRLKMNKYFGQ